jgi:hypothetical protein
MGEESLNGKPVRKMPLARQYMIYLLTAIGLPPGDSSTVHIYTQNKQYIERHKKYRWEDNIKMSLRTGFTWLRLWASCMLFLLIGAIPLSYLILNKMVYSVLTKHQYINMV